MTNFVQRIIETYNKGLKYDAKINQYEELLDHYLELEYEQDKEIYQLVMDKKELQEKLSSLNEQLDINSLQNWYEGRRLKKKWTYNGGRGLKDVKDYLKPSDDKPFISLAQQLIDTYRLSTKNIATEIIGVMYKYFNKSSSWKYAYDRNKYHKEEMWEDPTLALSEREGDCESKAMVMLNTAVEMLKILDKEKDIWRLTFVCSRVLGEGGHGYLTWLHNDGNYYVIESTYDPVNSKRKTWLKTPIINNNLYQNFWGFANHKQSWKGSNSAFMKFE